MTQCREEARPTQEQFSFIILFSKTHNIDCLLREIGKIEVRFIDKCFKFLILRVALHRFFFFNDRTQHIQTARGSSQNRKSLEAFVILYITACSEFKIKETTLQSVAVICVVTQKIISCCSQQGITCRLQNPPNRLIPLLCTSALSVYT